MSSQDMSFIKYFSREESGSCGYCKSNVGCERHGMWAFKMTVHDYQDLIDRGWRRSGQYLYKPVMSETCCPMYTIRCDAQKFSPSKSQKRIIKRMNRYLMTGEKPSQKIVNQISGNITPHCKELEQMTEAAVRIEKNEVYPSVDEVDLSCVKPVAVEPKLNSTTISKPFHPPSDLLKNMSKANSMKAKQMRIHRKLDKLREQGLNEDEVSKRMLAKKKKPVIKQLDEFINALSSSQVKHKLEVRLVRSHPRSQQFDETYDAGFNLFSRYQMAVHKDPPGKITRRSYERFLVNSPLETRLFLTNTPEFETYFSLHASLFAKYQTAIHNDTKDECNESVFRHFLVDSPLQACGQFGSFHQQYWIDGVLIGVGVIDILPRCVSSVYYFYDPDYSFLCLGTYGAIREIHLVRTFLKSYLEQPFYYMGYYIRSCPKMRYKAAFCPSFLLCPEAYTWHPISSCLPKLDSNKYSRLDENQEGNDETEICDISNILALHSRRCTRIGQLALKSGRDILKEYCLLVGKNCAERMVFCIDSSF